MGVLDSIPGQVLGGADAGGAIEPDGQPQRVATGTERDLLASLSALIQKR